jgi:hypothetical protein
MIALLLTTLACHVGGAAPFVTPDQRCTPGAYATLAPVVSTDSPAVRERKERTAACTHKARPPLPPLDRTWILRSYGVPGWSGHDGELDHRVPFFLGGTTDRRNIWPEVGRIPNTKDQLEFYVFDRVCKRQPHPMRVSTARHLFFGDWPEVGARFHLWPAP